MEVEDWKDCLSMDIVGGRDSLFKTFWKHKYILTRIDGFTRFDVAVSLVDLRQL